MYTASPGSTKSTIQALLRSKEEQQQRQDSIEGAKFFSAPVDDSNGNSQEDFSYSQKLFHISDGNLYSIFSPLQGRSYGMKPSFLRKHTYTLQESCRGARKGFRKGLKFHNFLPSETLTSENDSKWRRVYSECRLREEHGTKQITISNWSHTSPDHDRSVTNNESSSTEEDSKPIADPYDLQAPLPLPKGAKRYSLDSVLNSLKEKSLQRVDGDTQNRSLQKKHRRKPVQTRRVVPYVQYLSILEESDSLPLDLSSKCLIQEEPLRSPLFAPPTHMNAPGTLLYHLPPHSADQGSKKLPPKRRNQRSAMKQRLEDTFRQNGFLVKTKQVSDGDATFCKFRQLRKYTRYYLKSLEQHLPDEFHKMWKGFLPPKTVLPQ